MIRMSNGSIRVDVDDGIGGEIVFLGRSDGPNLLASYDWAAPLPATRSLSYGNATDDWHSEYRGRWQELFPNPGHEAKVFGVTLPFHGEVSRARWDVVRADVRNVVLRVASRLPLVLERRMRLADGPTLLIEETVINEADIRVPYLWGHHPAFEAVPGTRIDLPESVVHVDPDFASDLNDLVPGAEAVWPHVPRQAGDVADLSVVPDGPTERLCYVEPLEGWASIRQPTAGVGIAMAWDRRVWPCAWLWTEVAGTGFPWYGRARIVALEPNAIWPPLGLDQAIDLGVAPTLEPRAGVEAWLTVSVFEATDRPVVEVTRDGRLTVGGEEPKEKL